MKSGMMMSFLAQNATVVQSIAMNAIAVMTVAIAGILIQVYAWQTLTPNQNS
jgi:hypothetical protein